MAIQTGPCEPWPYFLDCTTCHDLLGDTSPGDQLPDRVQALVDRWSRVTTTILFNLSGRRWGPSCPLTVRPCRRSCVEQLGATVRWGMAGPYVPYMHDGKWYNASPCGCGDRCHCGGEICEVRLDGPVHDIREVRIDGMVLDPVSYRVDAPNLLTRTDGGCWPSCSDLLAPCDEPGSFCVTYRYGLPLDQAAIAAHSALLCEFLRACPELASKDCPCRLPGNVQRVVRQNTTIDLMTEPTSVFSEGRTGVTVTDAWLYSVNPAKISHPPRVLSPDFRRPRVTTHP